MLSPIPFSIASINWVMADQEFFGFGGPRIVLVLIGMGIGFFCGPLVTILLSYPGHLLFRLFGGSGSAKRMQTCIAWSYVPYVPVLVWVIVLALFGPMELFLNSTSIEIEGIRAPGVWGVVDFVFYFLSSVMGIWSLVILFFCISEAENITVSRVALGFGSIFGGTFLLFFVLGVLSGVFGR